MCIKKVNILLLVFTIFLSCTVAGSDQEEISLAETDVKLEFTSAEPNYDGIDFSYYDNSTDKFNSETLKFQYDTNGNALPLVVLWEDFGYRFIRGNAYRNNFSTA